MDVSQVSSAVSALQNQKTGDAVGVSVLKKALESQSQGAQQLINSLPQPQKPADPTATLGRNIDVKA
ncbi:MAG: YjfB family protein [Sulfuricellaceae bacterium]|jgi:hypothetical protein